jgi:hypothetical protein
MGLMAEMDASLEKLAHRKFWQRHAVTPSVLPLQRRRISRSGSLDPAERTGRAATEADAACEMARVLGNPETDFNPPNAAV